MCPADDFVLLLCAAQQWRVFVAERTEEWLRAAGENADRLDLGRDPHNPTPNFIHCRCVGWGPRGRGWDLAALGWGLGWDGTPATRMVTPGWCHQGGAPTSGVGAPRGCGGTLWGDQVVKGMLDHAWILGSPWTGTRHVVPQDWSEMGTRVPRGFGTP